MMAGKTEKWFPNVKLWLPVDPVPAPESLKARQIVQGSRRQPMEDPLGAVTLAGPILKCRLA